ncbi:4'-phosphopantetheinyl transferase AcpT [Vagococcus sp. WN89Y]|uniref:4'-phosphopantetheinyl transferase AcpT n=1 Tax=Vagococcus sp. WN89Y TaxID=3457258 RepID=UPI003FCD1949
MYRLLLGTISSLCTGALPATLMQQAPKGARRNSWLAGRMLLAQACDPLPEICYGEQGKPMFANDTPLWFNISHSGDRIALLLSDEGEVGCDIEMIRPRDNWLTIANAVFSQGEHQEIEQQQPEQQLTAFWRIWTRKEAIIKQRGGSAWQIVSVDSSNTPHLNISHYQLDGLCLSVCTPTAFTLSAAALEER